MSKWIAFLLASCALGQDPRQIVEEVQRRNRSTSQRYEGTLTVTSAKSRVTQKRWRYERMGSFGDSKAALRFLNRPK